MKARELKAFLESLTEQQLDRELLYNSPDRSISGTVVRVQIAKENLYWDGEDDPSQLFTKGQLKEQGMDADEISDMVIEIHKGDVVFII